MSNNPKILVFENTYKLTNYLLKLWIDVAKDAIQKRDCFTVALSGGRSPVEFYVRLSNFQDFDVWQKTHFFMVDERFVSPDHRDSNIAMVRDNLLNYVGIPQLNIHHIKTHQKDVKASAADYAEELKTFFNLQAGQWPVFDLMLLGIGDDGHTASLFPGSSGTDEIRRITVPVSHDHLRNERISLTLPVINNARQVVFLVTGDTKADVIQQLIDEKADLPANRVMPNNGTLTFLLDRGSAKKLKDLERYSRQEDNISLFVL